MEVIQLSIKPATPCYMTLTIIINLVQTAWRISGSEMLISPLLISCLSSITIHQIYVLKVNGYPILLLSLIMKMTIFWGAASSSLVENDRRFGGAFCLHLQGDSTIPEESPSHSWMWEPEISRRLISQSYFNISKWISWRKLNNFNFTR
jgi:hypothetical protein